ncbi:ABC transporter permease subunit [Demequina sediminicola]|uniref:ABC transporter permease subunit n=1 Tax=Demequina sediminicola TaxID=1095026 RepID=UPI000781F9D6|nr:ABC transporter permease subunit [Demequina sediminicola]
MLRSVYLKTLRDKWLAATIGVASLFLIAWAGLWAYAGLGTEATDLFSSLPEAYLSLLGISPDSGPEGLMLSNLFNFIGPFVIAGIAISMGASAIAGEESNGTINVLGALPRSRTRLVTSTSLAVATIAILAASLATASFLLALQITGSHTDGLNLVAAGLHMLVVSLFYGAVALALGAATGNRALASGTAVAFLVVSFLASGMLPMFEAAADWAKVFPWYWISGPNPLANGVDAGPLLVIGGLTVVLFAVALWGYSRRDLHDRAVRAPLMARLLDNSRVAPVLAKLTGNGSARGVAAMALADLRALLIVAGGGAFFMTLIVGPMFNALADTVGDVVGAMPEGMLAMVGFADMSTAEGWYYGEMLSIVAPVAVAVVAIAAGTALAREEQRRTVEVTLAAPISRSAFATRKALAIASGSAIIGVAVAAGIAAGNLVGNLGMDYGHIAATGLLLAALGCSLGAVSFFASGVTGNASIAMGAGTGVAILGWGLNAFLPINPDIAHWAQVSPFYYFADGNPLEIGLTWSYLAILVGAAFILVSAGVWGYTKRDLRV